MGAPWRIFWLFVLTGHGLGGAAWWWLAPGGFSVGHPRFWTSSVIPMTLVIWCVVGLAAACRGRRDILRGALCLFPGLWLAASASARLAFATTFARTSAIPLAIGLLMAVAFAACFRGELTVMRRRTWMSCLGGVLLGVAVPVLMSPPPARTRPVGAPGIGEFGGVGAVSGAIGEGVFVSLGDASTTIRQSPLRITVQPILRFLERSPDGAPTVFVPARIREGRAPGLVGATTQENGLDLLYRSDYEAMLRIETLVDGSVQMDAKATLSQTIWSHLNSYCDIDVSGHLRLSLSFSPCPETQVEVRPMDYPVGRPLRFAYLDAAGLFRVVEATSGEKGPFRELASGPLERGIPLTITLHDQGEPISRIELEDWSAQVDTGLSPTAGWGAPVNAIEFCLSGDGPESSASIYVTLAATSVGRGWDCVGHRAGIYRNRVRVEGPRGGS